MLNKRFVSKRPLLWHPLQFCWVILDLLERAAEETEFDCRILHDCEVMYKCSRAENSAG